MKRVRTAVAAAAAAIVVAGCGGTARSTAADHPGPTDRARSARVAAEVTSCARRAGWALRDLDLQVDARGLLIRANYRAQQLRPPSAGDAETVEACLRASGVRRPDAGG